MSQKLANKVAVVTGASKGIGAAIAKSLAAEGATVVVNYSSSKPGADQVVAEIEAAGGKAVALHGNMSQGEDIERLFAEVRERFGKIDVLVNNAGIYEFAPVEEVTPDHFHKQFNLNVLGLILATKAAVKYFNPEGGSVVNISSIVSVMGSENVSVYSGTKGAVDAVTRSLAKELGPKQIRVNAINPGLVVTEGTHAAGIVESDFHKDFEARTPLGRVGKPEDIASVAVFFASGDSAWVTGETLVVAGGLR